MSDVPSGQLRILAHRLVPRKYRRGQVIFHQGDPGTSVHIIESGEVKIVLVSEDGEELLVTILGKDDFFGELALLDGHPRAATAIAITDTETQTIGRAEFLDFLRGSSEAAIAVAAALATRLRYSDERLSESAFLDLQERLGRRLLHLAQTYGHQSSEGMVLDLPLSQRELAGLVGATRQSVNKVLSLWAEAGILRREGRTLILLKPERFRRAL